MFVRLKLLFNKNDYKIVNNNEMQLYLKDRFPPNTILG